jgi:AcrR family transcriptional regulator
MTPRRQVSKVRRTEILDAAMRVIAERGLCDSRISDIARQAGTSSALVVYYFGTKDRLLAEALASSEERFYEQTSRELARLKSAVDRLVRLIELSSVGDPSREGWVGDWGLWIELWVRAPRDPVMAAQREQLDRRWREKIAAIVRDGQERREFADVDAEEFSLRLAALIDGLAIQMVLRDPQVTPQRMFELCVGMASRELGFAVPDGPRAASVSAQSTPL